MYKYSLYNNIIKLEDGTKVLYNSLSHAIMKIREDLPPSIDSLPTSVKDEFIEHKIIVRKEIDEFEETYKMLEENLLSNRSFHMIINPTLNCNCRCWYCIENHPQSKMSDKTISQIKSLICKVLPTVDSLVLSFFGGEPFLEFKEIVYPFMQWATELCNTQKKRLSFVFTSNSLLLTSEIIKKLSAFKNINFQITLDGNRESHNLVRKLPNADSYSRIVNNIGQLASYGIPVLLRLNITHKNIHTIPDIPADFASFSNEIKNNITLTCQQVWQDVSNGKLNTKFLSIYKQFANIGIMPSEMTLDVLRESCYADRLNHVLVNYNGDLYKCSALEYTGKDNIGNIHTSDVIDILSKNFQEFIKLKKISNECEHCRIYPLCARGCYKRVMISKKGCLYPTESQKDSIIYNNLDLIAFKYYIESITK